MFIVRTMLCGQNASMDTSKREIAASAARLVVEEGLEYGPAKRRALRDLGLSARTALPKRTSSLTVSAPGRAASLAKRLRHHSETGPCMCCRKDF